MRRMNSLLLVAAAVAVALWAVGYFSQRQPRVKAEARVAELQAKLATEEQRVRLFTLKDELRMLLHSVEQDNYGIARSQAPAVFDRVRAESERAPAHVRPALERVLAARDRVTTGLVQADPGVREPLRQAIDTLRQQLGSQPLYSSGQADARPAGSSDAPGSGASGAAPR